MYTLKESGTSSHNWKQDRELYKKVIVYDTPDIKIPENVAPHLKSDLERLMYKQAWRAVEICLDNKIWDNDYVNPKELKKDLLNINTDSTRGLDKKYNLDFLDEIMWNACMSLDIQYDIGYMLHSIEEIDSYLKYFENKKICT